MGLMILLIPLALSVVLILAWALVKPLPEEASVAISDEESSDSYPRHAQHFPQFRQTLASLDRHYVQRRVPRQTRKVWRGERRRVLLTYLDGLGQDFVRLEQLARMVSPMQRISEGHADWQIEWLVFRFRANYRMVWIAVSILGVGSSRQIGHLAKLVGALSLVAGQATL